VFLGSLNHYRLGGIDPATAVRVGESICPMLAEPGQDVADVAARVADELGRPIGPATMFTSLAIQTFCPRAVRALTDGKPFSFFD
jgi:3-hydroxyacyl-CoA dehydrogenase